jgi:hypothetical protein
VDTEPGAPKKRSAFPLRVAKIKPPAWRGQKLFWWGAASATGVILLGLVVAFWSSISVSISPRAPSSNQPNTLYVNRAGGENVSKTLGEALHKAGLGDRIVIADDFIAEQLELTKANKQVTIEADAGRVVVWHCPEQLTDTKQLLVVRGAEGLRLRGITLDGGNRVDQIALLQGDCPGLTMENMCIRGFNRCGILVANCAGQRGNPVSLARVQITTEEDRDAALAFVLNPLVFNPKINRHFRIHDCRFEGPYKTPIQGAERGIAEWIDIDKSTAQPRPGLPVITVELPR